MFVTRHLQDLGQSLWLDSITSELLNSGTLEGYIRDFSAEVSPVSAHDTESTVAATRNLHDHGGKP